jgi:hypothetical protein
MRLLIDMLKKVADHRRWLRSIDRETNPTSQAPNTPEMTAEASRLIEVKEKPNYELTAGSRSWKLMTPMKHSRSRGPSSFGGS